MDSNKKVLLIILDGWGITPIEEGNAPLLASTPTLDYIYKNYPKTLIASSGLEVGLHRGEMGNSEVGHLNLGTGRVVWESLPRIDYAIEKGEFLDNPALKKVLENAKGKKLHLIGLLSSGGVHSHMHHLDAILDAAHDSKVGQLFIHAITDGRDTQSERALDDFSQYEKKLDDLGLGKIATVIGRYYAMDRDNRWDRTEKAYKLFVNGVGKEFGSSLEAIRDNYKNDKSDEFIEPSIIDKDGVVENGDSVVFFNFRGDRMRQLVHAFYDHDFHHFNRKQIIPLTMATMMRYDEKLKIPTIFSSLKIENPLAEILSEHKFSQFHIAETEKYPHVTYFFNGGKEDSFPNETRKLVPSPKVDTYDEKPEMSAEEVTDNLLSAIEKDYNFILVNFANGDMVGHTGILEAGIKACEKVDSCLDKVLISASKNGYKTFVTADHGNCEIMIDPSSGNPLKEHTTSPVPLIFLDFEKHPYNNSKGEVEALSKEEYLQYASGNVTGVLSDVTVTILALFGFKRPSNMSGSDILGVFGD